MTSPAPRPASWIRVAIPLVFLLLQALATPSVAQETVQGAILDQDLQNGQGITVLHVWGSHYEMGYAHGVLLADWIQLSCTQLKSAFSSYWPAVRTRVAGWTFLPAEAVDELQGILDGVRSVHPETTLDLLDLKACGTFGDWSYGMACRSTACWGEWVETPYATLSVRKLQFYTLPGQITQQWHHVICAWEPADGSPQWVNFGFPGCTSAVTGVSEHGTTASLHDWNSAAGTNWADALPRTMACRWVLTMDLPADPAVHLQTVFDALQPYHAATGGFLNYYVPNGGAGVIKCSKNQGFYAVRTPRLEYMNGESISTNNSDIDGTIGIEPWDAYYQTLDPPSGVRATMDGLWSAAWQSTDMHIVEVGLRDRRDLTIAFQGRLQTAQTERVVWEWGDLFQGVAGTPDPGAETAGPETSRVDRGRSIPNPSREHGVSIVIPAGPEGGVGMMRLGVFDAAGRLVRTLGAAGASSRLSLPAVSLKTGEQSFHWDGKDEAGRTQPAGVYLGRLLGAVSPARAEGSVRVIWLGR